MMTAKSGDVEQVKSFGNGVDDYIKKPFMLALLKARIEAVLKRTYKSENRYEKLEAGKLSLDCKARKVYVNNQYIVTTPKEFDLLSFFIENQNVTLKREQILDAVWGPDYDGTYRTVDTIVKQIRIKLSDECPYIKSIYGIGYIFEVEDVKTIKSRMIFMQTITILFILGILFVLLVHLQRIIISAERLG